MRGSISFRCDYSSGVWLPSASSVHSTLMKSMAICLYIAHQGMKSKHLKFKGHKMTGENKQISSVLKTHGDLDEDVLDNM